METIKTIELYGGKVKVEFNPVGHKYIVNGKRPISVTAVTGILDKPALKFWSVKLMREYLLNHLKGGRQISEELILEGAKQHTLKTAREATSGTMVHEWAEQFIKGLSPAMPDDERVANGVMAFLDWVKDFKIKFIASEQLVYSKKFDYVGLMDCKFTMGSEKHKVVHCGDFKTSSGIYNEMRYQVSAYQHADAEESGCDYGDKWIIRFDKDTGLFEAKNFPLSDHKKDFSAFAGLLAAKRRQDELSTK